MVSPDSATAYIGSANLAADRVNTLQGTEETPLSYSPGVSFSPMAMSPDGSILYIPTFSGIDEYHPATGVLTKNAIPSPGGEPFGVAVSPDGSTLYLSGNTSNDVYAINTSTGALLATIPAGNAQTPCCCHPTAPGCMCRTTRLARSRSSTRPATRTSRPSRSPAFWRAYQGVNFFQTTCISPDGSTLYVPGHAARPGERGQHGDRHGHRADQRATALFPNPSSCAVSPDGSQLWVAYRPFGGTASGVAVFSTSSGHALLSENNSASVQDAIEIAFGPDQAPARGVSVTPGPEFQGTQFDASASTVPYGTITNYAWDFGDGTTASTSTPTTSHVYTSPGPFTATVTETDSTGTSTATSTVSIGTEDLRSGGPQARASQTVTPLPPGRPRCPAWSASRAARTAPQNPGDGTAPLAGATVTLLAPDGSVLDSATTDSSGNFSLNGKYEPGQQVQVSGLPSLSPAVPGQFDLASGIA